MNRLQLSCVPSDIDKDKYEDKNNCSFVKFCPNYSSTFPTSLVTTVCPLDLIFETQFQLKAERRLC